jgi:hypothetical protein
LRTGERSPVVVETAMLVLALLLLSSEKLVPVLVLCLVSTEGSMVRGESSSGMVVEWMGRLYWPFSVKWGGDSVSGAMRGESA